MPDPFIPLTIKVGTPTRGAGSQSTQTFVTQSAEGTFSWGSSPGRATLVYVGTAVPVTTGSEVRITIGNYFFYGLCRSDVINKGSRSGTTHTMEFVDIREYLTWDYVACIFNKLETRLVNGVRKKYYKHMYPADHPKNIWSYTDSPLLGAQILSAVMNYQSAAGGTVGTPWAWDLTGAGLFPNGVMSYPIYDFDCYGSERLDSILNRICEKMGCVFTLMSTPASLYQLVFTRKGYGGLPAYVQNSGNPFPPNSEDRRLGKSLSGNATNVKVMGDRNLYQVMDVPLEPDWARAWEKFMVFDLFADDIFQKGTDPRSGQRFNAITGDPEQYIGRQLATARALEISVREYVALTADSTFADNRMFAGRLRMDMPAALYIQTLLFRAFRPATSSTFGGPFVFKNGNGDIVPLDSLDIVDKLLCKVSHEPLTGNTSFDVTQPTDGNGYAIAKGYQVGEDLFKTIRSDQFTLDLFTNAKCVWQHIPFQLDDSGEGVRFVIFDQPVITSENLIVNVNGMKVINAGFTLSIPQVKACLVFAAERFIYWKGTYPNVSRDKVENASGLRAEVVRQGNSLTEILYSNGESAVSKASALADSLLVCQYIYDEGGYRLPWDGKSAKSTFGIPLTDGTHSMIDRVAITTGPTSGTYLTLDLTNERSRDYFEPERDLDRRTTMNTLFPGQQELRVQAEYARKLAAAFRDAPGLRQLLGDLLNGSLGQSHPLMAIWVKSPPVGTIAVGTPMRKTPTTQGLGTNTLATYPTLVTSADSVFLGVTVRDGENGQKPFYVQSTGMGLARVMGPVSAGDSVGLTGVASDYLVAGGAAVGTVLQAISTATVALVQVMFGAGGGGGNPWKGDYSLLKAYSVGDIVRKRTADGGFTGATGIFVCVKAAAAGTAPEFPEPADAVPTPGTTYWQTITLGIQKYPGCRGGNPKNIYVHYFEA